MMYLITKWIGNALLLENKYQKYVCSWIPSFVESVVIISHEENRVIPMYSAYKSFFRWSNNKNANYHLPKPTDVFVIRVWNQFDQQVHTYFLHAKYVCEALKIKSIDTWWALHDVGIVTLLANYQQHHMSRMPHILSILWNNQDITNHFKHVLPCFTLYNNISTHSVLLYYSYLTHQDLDLKKDEDLARITIVDYDLEERTYHKDEFVSFVSKT